MNEIPQSKARTVALIWAPQCDRLTKETSYWAIKLLAREGDVVRKLVGKIDRLQIQQSLGEDSGIPAIAFFLGHGLTDALIGHPFVTKEGNPVASPIYDSSMIPMGPRSLFAFCCYSGHLLGPSFDTAKERSFLGFNGPIGIFVSNDSTRRIWQNLLERMLAQSLADGRIRHGHLAMYKRWINETLDHYSVGPGRNLPEATIMTIYLLQQHDSLVFYGA